MCLLCENPEAKTLQTLTMLDCAGCPNLTQLPSLPALTSLDCRCCPKLTHLSSLPALIFLDCRQCPGLTQLPAMPALIYLNCSRCPGLTQLPSLPVLTCLDCNQCFNLKQLPDIPFLTDLNCADCRNLIQLPELPSLTFLYCFGCTWLYWSPGPSLFPPNPDYQQNVTRLLRLQTWFRRWAPLKRMQRWVRSEEFNAWYYSPGQPGQLRSEKRWKRKCVKRPREDEDSDVRKRSRYEPEGLDADV